MKRRIWTLILSTCMLLPAIGCTEIKKGKDIVDTTKVPSVTQSETKENEEIRTINIVSGEAFANTRAENSYHTIMNVSYPVVHTNYGDEDEFAELEKAFEAENNTEKKKQLKYREENKTAATEAYEELGENFQMFESTVNPAIRRADTIVTSVLYCAFDYFGGAHGSYYYYGANYDTKTGKKLSLSEVVEDKKELCRAISEQLDTFYPDGYSGSEADVETVLNDEKIFSWTLDYNGITFYFMPFTIVDTASSELAVTVLNEEYPKVMKNKFKASPKAYGVELANAVPFYFDLNDDGKTDEIIFSAYEADYNGNSGGISISVNDKVYDMTDWFFEADATFIHQSDGSDYIYVEVLRENDYTETYCFKIEGGVSEIGYISGGLRRKYYDEEKDFFVMQDALTNPDVFYLEKITQHISTRTGYKKYHVGSNGMPVGEKEQYTFDEDDMLTFTILQDIDCDIYDEKSATVSGRKRLKKGDKVVYYSTDSEKYAILKCEDGILCRIEVVFDEDEGFFEINEIDIREVFDGLFFAG